MNTTNTNKETAIEKITCECGTIFQWSHDPKDEFALKYMRPDHCAECSERIEAERERKREEIQRTKNEDKLQKAKAETEADVWRLIPPRYQQTEIKHPAFNVDLWKKVKAWRPSEEVPFLGMIGESGACKTRISYILFSHIVGELVRAYGEPEAFKVYLPEFAALTSSEFALLVGAQFKSTPGITRGWNERNPKDEARDELDRIRACDVLFLDDLGKAKHTASVAAELFGIIDHRHANNLTTLWTANSEPEEIVNGMSEDMAGPLAGRLIECSSIIRV